MKVDVTIYPGLRQKSVIIDEVGRAQRRRCETVFTVDPNAMMGGLLEIAGISPAAWAAYLRETHGFDVQNPGEDAIRKAYPDLSDNYVAGEMRKATENAEEYWSMLGSDQEDSSLWSVDEDVTPFLTPADAAEIIGETLGEGLPFVAFRTETETLRDALSDDNEITIGSEAIVGLLDPVNGAGHFRAAAAPIAVRPSAVGKVVFDDQGIAGMFGTDGVPETSVSYVAGEPLLLSSRATAPERLGPPNIDLSVLTPSAPRP